MVTAIPSRRPSDHGGESLREPVPLELVDLCKQGDEQAWARLVEATHREVYSLCLRILRDPDDAAEATQDAYLKAWRGLAGFRGEAMFRTWLYRVATNAAISKQRGRRRRQSHEIRSDDDMLAQLPSADRTESAAGAKLELRAVEAALARLPEHHRTVVVLRDVYGLSIEEIATQLDISETAAKVRVHRGRKRLREAMFPEGSGPE